MFSERTAWDLADSALTVRLAERRRKGDLIDLTMSNPTHCDFFYDEALLTQLSEPGAAVYDPAPLGATAARRAVAQYYADHCAQVPLDRICLTTGTSEGYSFLFRLLCDPGDEVLVAQPSYPLFEFIARLDGVTLREFPLHCDPGAGPQEEAWSIDLDGLAASISSHTRAIILVHPNNPTGNFVSGPERRAIQALCAERNLALIVDEVFLDFALGSETPPTFVREPGPCLSFVLSGISKLCGLPQMKASWIVAIGSGELVDAAMARLEVIADTFLSMNAPVQYALGSWLGNRAAIQQQILTRVRENVAALDRRLPNTSATRYAVGGGWTVVLRVPRDVQGQPFVEAALERGVLVQPGDFYGLSEGRCVLSLLTPPLPWQTGIARLPID